MQIQWGNLVDGKCPKCEKKLKRHEKLFICEDEAECSFAISEKKFTDLLLDTENPVFNSLTLAQRAVVETALNIR